ncbi:MAG: universal stress protein [Phycisphaeraceae bacterium]|nr:universal stress protein [Phycisphaeraceae bacterium]
MPKSKMLVAVSTPWASEKLAGPLSDLARRLHADVLVAHVAQQHDADESETDARQRGQQTLMLLVEDLREIGVQADGVMLFSENIAKAILNTAKARDCTMIVLGLTGRGVLKRLIAGDVPSAVIRQADLPVLLLPANWEGTL